MTSNSVPSHRSSRMTTSKKQSRWQTRLSLVCVLLRGQNARPAPVQNAGREEMFECGSERQEPNLPEDYDPWSGL